MKFSLVIAFFLIVSQTLYSQDDLMSDLMEEGESDKKDEINYATSIFKTTRVINLHSLENKAEGELDFKLSHRFGELRNGVYDLFGLDAATMRIGLEYGFTDNLMLGWGRSTLGKTYDGFAKYRFMRQSTGAKNMPLTMAWFSSMAINTQRGKYDEFAHGVTYVHQIIAGRKVSEGFSIELVPTMVHRNYVDTSLYSNDVFALGIGTRLRLTRRTSLNTEYVYVFPNQIADNYQNSLSIGFDIETGGHVFQLHFTNSASMIEKGYITETTGDFFNGDIHFGFNIARVFVLK